MAILLRPWRHVELSEPQNVLNQAKYGESFHTRISAIFLLTQPRPSLLASTPAHKQCHSERGACCAAMLQVVRDTLLLGGAEGI